MIHNLVNMKKKFLINDKKIIIDILSEKSVFMPSFTKKYLDNIYLIKSKEKLIEHIVHFITNAAHVGFIDFDASKLLNAFRILHQDPSKVEDKTLLNLMVSDDF